MIRDSNYKSYTLYVIKPTRINKYYRLKVVLRSGNDKDKIIHSSNIQPKCTIDTEETVLEHNILDYIAKHIATNHYMRNQTHIPYLSSRFHNIKRKDAAKVIIIGNKEYELKTGVADCGHEFAVDYVDDNDKRSRKFFSYNINDVNNILLAYNKASEFRKEFVDKHLNEERIHYFMSKL